MRFIGGLLCALIGGYLLWMTIRFARVLLIVDTMPGEGTAIAVMVGTTVISVGLLCLSWRLVRKARA